MKLNKSSGSTSSGSCTVDLVVVLLLGIVLLSLGNISSSTTATAATTTTMDNSDNSSSSSSSSSSQQQQQQQPKKRKKILSLGGNGMIGSETLSMLFTGTNDEAYDITLVSRGSWPYDTSTIIEPFVKRVIQCDREDGVKNCYELTKEIDKTDEYYAVLDFSGYYPKWIQESVELLKNKARVYVYVSTDSVYEVTVSEPYIINKHKSLETDAIRPKDINVRTYLNNFDEYGNEKFAGEEILISQRFNQKDVGIPFVALRFADVIGPRDGTGRFVTLYSWIKYYDLLHNIVLPSTKHIYEATSITYVKDAAKVITNVIHNEHTWNEAYNIACDDIFNVTQFITDMGQVMNQNVIPTKAPDNDDDNDNDDDDNIYVLDIYPSVTKGPIDINKAKKVLNFKPTPINIVIKETIEWYNNYYQQSSEFREEVEDEIIEIIESTTTRNNFYDSEDDDDDDDDDDNDEMMEDAIERFLEQVRRQYPSSTRNGDDTDEL